MSEGGLCGFINQTGKRAGQSCRNPVLDGEDHCGTHKRTCDRCIGTSSTAEPESVTTVLCLSEYPGAGRLTDLVEADDGMIEAMWRAWRAAWEEDVYADPLDHFTVRFESDDLPRVVGGLYTHSETVGCDCWSEVVVGRLFEDLWPVSVAD